MQFNRNIRRILFISCWLLAGAGVVVLLVAAVNSRSSQVCNGYEILINGNREGQWFTDRKDIVNALTNKKTVNLKDKPIKSFDLNRIEAKLKKEEWVKDAELFFDNNGILKVKITERQPIARVFATTGQSFYIDSTGKRLPLSGKLSARLPVFTSYPFAKKKSVPTAEKKLLMQIKELSLFLLNDPFWRAQVSQVDITPSREFEIVPTIGNHIIEFGDAKNKEDKFHRLFVFYRQVLSKTGMEKYERIKVQYDKQVIGVKEQQTTNN